MRTLVVNSGVTYEPTEEELEQIKRELTFDNPAYISAMKYSGYSRVNLPKYLRYYREHSKSVSVPIGFDFSKVLCGEVYVEDQRVYEKVETPDFVLTLREDQETASKDFLTKNEDVLPLHGIVQMQTGKGKAQPLYTEILTPEGFTKMRDIRVNDLVIGEDGLSHKVTGVFPQGVKPVFEITFKDGSKTRSCDEHLWKIRTANMRRSDTPYKVMTLKDIMKVPLKCQGAYNLRVPLNKPVEFSSQKVLPLDPYLLGCLIGDGSFTKETTSPSFSNSESDVVKRVISKLPEGLVMKKQKGNKYSWSITHPKHSGNLLNNILTELSLRVKSTEKFIPKSYLLSSIEERTELLKGLFDTDGCVNVPNGSFSYSTHSKKLANDLLFLCRSLGYRCSIRYGEECVVRIFTHNKIFHSDKHFNRSEVATRFHVNRNINKYDDIPITDIQYIGEEECQCIMVDSEDHTYLCDNFIVTHNTVLGLHLAHTLSCKTLIVVHKNDLVIGWQKDIKLAFNNKVKPGLIKAQKKEVGDFITIATVQTLNRMSPEDLRKLHNTYSLVILDELHHTAASSYRVVSEFNSRYKLGLTATPERTDGLTHVMNLYFGEFCYRQKIDPEDKDILPVNVIRKSIPIYYQPVFQMFESSQGRRTYKRVKKFDSYEGNIPDNHFRISEIPYNERPRIHYQGTDDYVVTNPSYKETVISDIYKEYSNNRSIVAFFTQKDHVREYFDILSELIPEDEILLYYGDNIESNEEMLRRAESGEAKVTLATYAKGTEGTNVKAWEVAFLVSSLNNEKNTEQAIGRIRRRKEGKGDMSTVYDYRVPNVYSVSSHGKTRDRRYRKLGFNSPQGNIGRSLFSHRRV